MKAPERIYLVEDRQKHEPMEYWYNSTTDDSKIEYTRTDAFIEKACEFLSKSSNYNEGFIYPSHSGVIDALVNNFKNYMKGE